MVTSRLLLQALVALLVAAPFAHAHGGTGDAVHRDQDEAIAQWLATLQLASPEEAEQLVMELGYPIPARPEERFTDYLAREDLTTAGALEGAIRVMRFAHITDLQLVDDDAPSPLRQTSADPVLGPTLTGGAQRPQEEYADEIMHSLVDILNAHHALDKLDFAIHTGDNIDNALENELMRYLDLMEGTHTTTGPVSNFDCLPDGQSESVDDDQNNVEDSCTSLPAHVVPELRGLAADLPWYSLYGNHDGLVGGVSSVEPSFQEAAMAHGRHFLAEDDYVRMHFEGLVACGGGSEADDFGHGYGFAGERLCDGSIENDAYYAFDHRGVRFIVLDTVNDEIYQGNANTGGAPDQSTTGYDFAPGLSEGAIDNVQWDWLVEELDAASDRPVILAAHHTINAFYSDYFDVACGPPGCMEDLLRAAGFRGRDDVKELIAQYPNIVSFIGGHTHEHRVTAQVGGLYGDHPGYWNIETSGMLDLPQESRIIELWVTADGSKAFFALDPIGHQFELAKQIAATDPDHDAAFATGTPEDRRVLLWFDVPAGKLPAGPQPPRELPEGIQLNILEPERHGDGPIHLHDPGTVNVTVSVTDLDGEPVEDIEVYFGITSIVVAEGEDDVVHTQEFRLMTDRGNGTFQVSQEFTTPASYQVGFNVVTTEGDDLGTEYAEIVLELEETGLPMVSLPVVLLVVAVVGTLLRRR